MRKLLFAGLLAFAAVPLVYGVAFATPVVGMPTITTFLRSTLAEPVHFNEDRIKFQTKGAADVISQKITWNAGDGSGWHTHPGVVLVSVDSGVLNYQTSDCVIRQYRRGESFVESGMEAARVVPSSSASTVYITYVVPQGAAAREDAPAPSCAG